MENFSDNKGTLQKSQKTSASPAALGPAKPVILRSEPEVRTEDACHRAERGLFLTAACKILVLKADGEYTVILESVAIGAGRQTSYVMQESGITGMMNHGSSAGGGCKSLTKRVSFSRSETLFVIIKILLYNLSYRSCNILCSHTVLLKKVCRLS